MGVGREKEVSLVPEHKCYLEENAQPEGPAKGKGGAGGQGKGEVELHGGSKEKEWATGQQQGESLKSSGRQNLNGECRTALKGLPGVATFGIRQKNAARYFSARQRA